MSILGKIRRAAPAALLGAAALTPLGAAALGGGLRFWQIPAASIISENVPAPAASAADATVGIDNFTFSQHKLTVKAGTTVTWTNEDDIPHTVVSSTKAFKSKVLDTGDKFTFTFTTPGTYEYFCSLHPHMTASIVVEAATGENVPK